MLSKLLTLTLITCLLAAPSPAKDASNSDLVGLDGLFSLADLEGITGDAEITRESKEEEEIDFKLQQLIEELEKTGDDEEDDLLGEHVIELEEEEKEKVEVVEEEEETETSTKSETDDKETETITDEGDNKESEDDGKYKGKGHNYRHKKKED